MRTKYEIDIITLTFACTIQRQEDDLDTDRLQIIKQMFVLYNIHTVLIKGASRVVW